MPGMGAGGRQISLVPRPTLTIEIPSPAGEAGQQHQLATLQAEASGCTEPDRGGRTRRRTIASH